MTLSCSTSCYPYGLRKLKIVRGINILRKSRRVVDFPSLYSMWKLKALY